MSERKIVRHVVQFSGGIQSWAAAKRVAAEHGTDNLTLLFADTKMEDTKKTDWGRVVASCRRRWW